MRSFSISQNSNYLGLLTANTILSSAMPMLLILGGLAGLMLAPSAALATLPASVQMLAGLFAAAPFSLLMGARGRKTGFIVGVMCAIIGALLGVASLYTGSFFLLCMAHLVLGVALSCYHFFRFAAAETVSAAWRPVAISLMLTSGLIAALVGPQLFIVAKDALAPIPLAGAYASLAILSVIGLIPLAFIKLPRPVQSQTKSLKERLKSLSVLNRKPVRLAVGLGATAQGVMVFMMVPTPFAMIGCGLSEGMASDVIRWHVVAMFAPSFFTGFLIKRFGTHTIAFVGLGLMMVSAVCALSGITSAHFYVSLVLLGVGWNFCFIGATSMLTNVVTEADKALVQGANDTVMALVSTVCAFTAGAIISGFGWADLAAVALVILALAFAIFVKETRSSAPLNT